MFCHKCGNQLMNGAVFCNYCGASVINSANSPHPQPVNRAAPVYQSAPYNMGGTHPYHRLGGFLLFIVVCNFISGIISFISTVPVIITYIGVFQLSSWLPGQVIACLWFALIGSTALSITAGVVEIKYANKIRHKDEYVLGYIQKASVTLLILSIIYYTITIIWVKSFDYFGLVDVGSEIRSLVGIIVTWLVSLLVSSIYFSSSVRVRTYMGSDSYLRKSLFNKHSKSPIPADGSGQYYQAIDDRRAYENADSYSQNSVDESKTYSYDSAWLCPYCGSVNPNNTGTCHCGKPKPNYYN